MRMQRRLTAAIVIKGLAIALCSLGCSEGGDHEQNRSANHILEMASVGDTLYLVDYDTGVFRLNNKKQLWQQLYYPGYAIFHTIFADETTLYIDCTDGLYRLSPDGETFTQITSPGILNTPTGIDTLSGPTAFAADGNRIYAASKGGKMFYSKNRGAMWHRMPSWPGADAGSYLGGDQTLNLLVKGNIIYVTSPRHVFRSVNGGREWTQITKGLHGPPRWVYDLVLSKNILYVSTEKGVYSHQISTDSWIPTGLADKGRETTSLVASRTALYAGVWQTDVFRSDDGGKIWNPTGLEVDGLHSWLSGVTISGLHLLNNRLYVNTKSYGVYYTDDEGNTWHPLNEGLNLPSDDE